MRGFFKIVFGTLVGIFLAWFLAFWILIGLAGSLSSDKEVTVKKNSVLHLSLNRPIVEREVEDPFEELMGTYSGAVSTVGLLELKSAIKQAATDENIKGIYLDAGFPTTGFATLREIRESLLEFKESGKFIIAYSEYYSEAGYYLASVADEIHLNPLGVIELNGLSTEVIFFKGLFEKLEIEPQIFRVGEFKSAVEPFMRTDMSEANRVQTRSFLGSLYTTYLKDVAASRAIDFDALSAIANQMQVRKAQDAVDKKLATHISYEDEVHASLRSQLGLEDSDKIQTISYKKYRKSYSDENYGSKDRIAVIMANGAIGSGESTNDAIGSATVAEEIRKARKDKKVKAVVLRINSPGGSLVASDVIWREVSLCTQEKPVIASMGDVAASGGYYIAMAADTIVAQPNTITGSIGIFGMLFNAKNLLNNKLGITTESIKTGEWSDMMTISRPLTDAEKAIIQTEIESGYNTFTTKAAEGRSMSHEALLAIASGRVWSGREAKERGLVDVMGGLDDAIAIAAAKAGLTEYSTRYFPKQKNFAEQLLSGMSEEAQMKIMEWQLGEYFPIYQQVKEVQKLQGVQALMPYEFVIQ
ncbi:signal peptide peptidase SppA [Cytophagales bacterium LB-30]|uniref:Signal peptide peptidase SppA n=1 Tax=Shiella aurantiaca TaxID=3058365 RepID=A0ABT8F597_9BACT|nr:signal peptide peptidase SppA [Shiella aurantiaca]MDN4165429.1 signal peptide peptidase SppA [Shiella aurantiaca]